MINWFKSFKKDNIQLEIENCEQNLIKDRNYQLFESIVGEDPLSQIDWIIENGMEKYNYWYKLYETGEIYNILKTKNKISNTNWLYQGMVHGTYNEKEISMSARLLYTFN